MIIISPLRVPVTKTKFFVLNLNVFRNASFFTLNTAKKKYKELIQNQLVSLPKLDKIYLTYIVYPKDKRLFDLDNVTSIHAKFFQDALVECGCIEQDNYLYIIGSETLFGEIDKLNPRCEIIITEVKE